MAMSALFVVWNVKSMFGCWVEWFDVLSCILIFDDGVIVEFDDCLIVIGSCVVKLSIFGADGFGVHCFWTLVEVRVVIVGVMLGSCVVMVGVGFIVFMILNVIFFCGAFFIIVEVVLCILLWMVDVACVEIVVGWFMKNGVIFRIGLLLRINMVMVLYMVNL